jgi:hypothetical protein
MSNIIKGLKLNQPSILKENSNNQKNPEYDYKYWDEMTPQEKMQSANFGRGVTVYNEKTHKYSTQFPVKKQSSNKMVSEELSLNDDDWYEINKNTNTIVKQYRPSAYQMPFGQREIKLPNGNILVRGMRAKGMNLTLDLKENKKKLNRQSAILEGLSKTVSENLGMPFPGTYEQEYSLKTNSNQQRMGTLTTEEKVDNKTSLKKIYNGQYPDKDEMFWDYISTNDLDKEVEVQTLSPSRLNILLLSQYRAEHIEEILDMLEDDEDRLELINNYRNDSNLPKSIIVIADNKIIDGNHRALASALNKSPINYIDINDIEEA